MKSPFPHHKLGWCFALLLYLLSGQVVAQVSLDELLGLKDSHATQLALRLMDEHQPDASTDSVQWMEWERERLQIYQQNKQWPELIERTETFPIGLNSEFLLWARTARAEALLANQQPAMARQLLRELIWMAAALDNKQQNYWLPQWRRRVIESYLEQGLLQDAYTAEQRFRQDYGLINQDDRLLRARILLLNNHIDEVVELLSKHTKDPQAGMLYLLAQLRGGDRSPKKVLQAALRQLRGKWVDEQLKHRLWAVIAEAARQSGDHYAVVNALEHLVALVKPQQLPRGLFKDMGADGLWSAYREVALQLGNEHQLLIGDDKNWLKLANGIEKTEQVKSRALYAFITYDGQQPSIIGESARHFLKATQTLTAHENLLKVLFLKSEKYRTIDSIPAPVRHALVDVALKQSDIPLASRIMATMVKPPEGVDQFMWQLRRARILVMGGDSDEGYHALKQLLAKSENLPRLSLDRYVQVIFDLQSQKAHDKAIELFAGVIRYSADQALQRELYFWMADSRKAQENYLQAAHLYLKSATLIDTKALDPWGQAARYQAASALVKAGLLNDARDIYQDLLKVTKDENRLAVLKQELKNLRLSLQEE